MPKFTRWYPVTMKVHAKSLKAVGAVLEYWTKGNNCCSNIWRIIKLHIVILVLIRSAYNTCFPREIYKKKNIKFLVEKKKRIISNIFVET